MGIGGSIANFSIALAAAALLGAAVGLMAYCIGFALGLLGRWLISGGKSA